MNSELTIKETQIHKILNENDVVLARQLVRNFSVRAGFGIVDQTKVVTAASELARNTLIYGGGGELKIDWLYDGLKNGIRLEFSDDGPGIQNLDLALTEGYTTGKGLGLGLTGSRRLMNEFTIISEYGEGTCVTVVRWK